MGIPMPPDNPDGDPRLRAAADELERRLTRIDYSDEFLTPRDAFAYLQSMAIMAAHGRVTVSVIQFDGEPPYIAELRPKVRPTHA
jgi:hypothetical protein